MSGMLPRDACIIPHRMAYGFATHLWIRGKPAPDVLKSWLQPAFEDVREEDIRICELGEWTLLMAVNDRLRRWKSGEIIRYAAERVGGFDTLIVEMQPDHFYWRIERSGTIRLEWDLESTPEF